VAEMLRRIPRSDEEAIPVQQLCPSQLRADSVCTGCVKAVVGFLHVFGAVEVLRGVEDDEQKVKAASETALYFLASLAAYMDKNLTLISDWERKGANGAHPVTQALSSGTQFLYVMERKRTTEHGDWTPTRTVFVSQAIIRAKARGKREPMYLMQYDAAAGRYQLIGGRKRSRDQNALEVMKREIAEELAANHLTYGDDYELHELVPDLTISELSRTYGAFTEYHFTIYQAIFDRKHLILGPNDRWVNYSELMAGRTKDGALLITAEGHNYFQDINERIHGGLQNLPLSIKATQRRPIKEIIRDRKWELVFLILALLGIALTVFFGTR